MAQEIYQESQTNPFDAPIPGQSLTNTPQNYGWEHPPQFTDVNEAMEFIMKKMGNVKMAEQVILMLRTGVPAEAIARVMLFGGFVEGKWTVDLAVLLAPLVLQLIIAIGMKAKVQKMKISLKDTSNGQFYKDMAQLEVLSETASTELQEELKQLAPQGGLMGRAEMQGEE